MADDRRLFVRPDAPHRVHDLLLIAAFAASDATPADAARAEALVAACDECRILADDLRVIQRATSALPSPALQPARDFRLSRADADRLRPRGVRGLVAAVVHPNLSRAQPIAAGLTMLGLAGLLASTISFSGPADAPTLSTVAAPLDTQEMQAPTDDPVVFGARGAGSAPAASPGADQNLPAAAPSQLPVADLPAVAERTDAVPRTAIAIGSALLVAVGVALFAVARRQRHRFS